MCSPPEDTWSIWPQYHYDVQRIWPANYARISGHLTGSCSCTRVGEQTLTSRGTYVYMDDLLELNARRPVHRRTVPTEVGVVTTPLIARAWEVELADHPDREFTSFVVEGIEKGFRIGFNYSSSIGATAAMNMHSAKEHPEPVDGYVQEELRTGRLIENTPGVHVSRFGVIPKPHQPGKWRLITDLSSPKGESVNDGVDRQWCSVSYASDDDAVRCIMRLGRGAKLDIASAYRAIPVYPIDRLEPRSEMAWRPVRLRSAPELFTAVADALIWAMGRHGVVHAMHYLDDFLILGPPDSEECSHALRSSLELCDSLGFPIASHKLEGPGTHLSFLGIMIDTVQGTLSLPLEKLDRLNLNL